MALAQYASVLIEPVVVTAPDLDDEQPRLILSGLHGAMVGQLRRAGQAEGSPRALAVMHIPVIGLVLVAIVLAVSRPF